MFVYYYLCIPGFDFAFMFIMYETEIIIRVIAAIIGLGIGLNMFYINYVLSAIGREARNSYGFLNSIIAKNGVNKVKYGGLNLRLMVKTIHVIERISGPVIGIYCLDLFPLTNYEFYQLCTSCLLQFALFLKFVN